MTAFVGDGFTCCEPCAREYVYDDLMKSLPDYVVNGIYRRSDSVNGDRDERLALAAALCARRYRRKCIRENRPIDHYTNLRLGKLEGNANGDDDTDVPVLVRAGLTDLSELGPGWDADAIDGEYCECGTELSEPMSVQDIVTDTWGPYGAIYDALPPGDDDRFFWRVAHEMGGDFGLRAQFYGGRTERVGNRRRYSDVEKAIAEAIANIINL